MNNITINKYTEQDLAAVLALHEETFFPIDGPEIYRKSQKSFLDEIDSGRVFVAYQDSKMAGFASYKLIRDSQVTKESMQNILAMCQDKTNEEQLLDFMESARQSYGKGEVCAKIYNSEFMRSNPSIQYSDVKFTELAVNTTYRRKGIGELLTRKRISEARTLGASAIYVSCWEGNNVSKLYDKLGFTPIVRAGPRYPDGNAEKVMVLRLE